MSVAPLLIMMAGPYSAGTPEKRAANLQAMNAAAVEVRKRGHVPVVGVNAALPVLEAAGLAYTHPWMMDIALALAARCDALLLIGRSLGADREADLMRSLGRPVYMNLTDLPARE